MGVPINVLIGTKLIFHWANNFTTKRIMAQNQIQARKFKNQYTFGLLLQEPSMYTAFGRMLDIGTFLFRRWGNLVREHTLVPEF